MAAYSTIVANHSWSASDVDSNPFVMTWSARNHEYVGRARDARGTTDNRVFVGGTLDECAALIAAAPSRRIRCR